MNRCEFMEASLSALMDGEADLHEQGEAVDHLLDCPDCREFWRRARGLQGRLDAGLPLAEPSATGRRLRVARGGARRWLQLAALLVPLGLGLGVGRWLGDRDGSRRALPPRGSAIELQLASDGGALNDGAFVDMVLTLLRADRRYHQQMLEILQHVEPGPGEGRAAAGELRPALEQSDDGETFAPATAGERRVVY